MKYIDRFWNFEVGKENFGLMKIAAERECIICGEPTFFLDICAETPICSDECCDKFYDDLKNK